jgi:hypothetical protein
MSTTHLLTEIQALSPELRRETEHFVEFLRTKQQSRMTSEREFGYAKEKVWLSPDFDAPLDDFADYQ